MSIKLNQSENVQTYCCTFTCKNWLYLFHITNLYLNDKWKLAVVPKDYFHSSAAFYLLNKKHELVSVTHWKDVGSSNASSA